MKIDEIVFEAAGAVAVEAGDADAAPLSELEGTRLEGVRVWQRETPWGRLELVELEAGSSLPLHSVDRAAICQVVRGRGRVGLADGRELPFEAPHLFTFAAGAVHSWHSIEQPTLISVCVVDEPE